MPYVCVRYAPSPTGIPHIGNIRTALFNFLFAKNQHGQFILRIEDTDRKRLIPDSIPKIEESLEILGLRWDEEFFQSKRLPLYIEHLEILKKKNLVYLDEGAWRFRIGKGSQKIGWEDVVHGRIEFPQNVLEDFIVIKSDGFPTYHFASVVDDHDMQISHVMRGDEWIPSTPKHLLLYKAFGWQPPVFIHLPPILSPQKKKLSKREGAKSVLEYIEEGYLPEALLNFLVLLGWSPKGDRELFSLDDLVKEFSFDRLNKNSPIFNIEKLNWFNKKYLQNYPIEKLLPKIKQISKYAKKTENKKIEVILILVRDRMVTLCDFDEVAKIFFEKGKENPPPKEKIQNAKRAIESIKKWDEDSIAKELGEWIGKYKLDPADFKNTLRLSIFAANTPPIYPSLAVLTKEEVLKRINDSLKVYK